MFVVDIVSWIVVGLVVGAAWVFLASGKGMRLPGALIAATFGALLGGFLFSGTGVHGKYNIVTLVTSIVGTLVVLFIYSTIFFGKRPQRPTQPTGSA